MRGVAGVWPRGYGERLVAHPPSAAPMTSIQHFAPGAASGPPLRHHVALLGPAIEHRDSLGVMLAGRVASVSWIPDCHSFLQRQQLRPRSRLGRGVDALVGTREPAYLDHVLSTLDEQGTTLIIAYWGTLPLSDVIAIRRARPRVRVALMLLCYPLSLTHLGIYRQKLALSRAWSSLDAILCPTAEMAEYLTTHPAGPPLPTVALLRPGWPAAFQARERPLPVGNEPNVIYVGRTDISGRTAHAADDIRPLMRAVLDAGILLYHGRSPETEDGHPGRRPFTVSPVRTLITTMASHDASLIAYNTEACQRPDRFDLTVPDRLLSSVAAGVPIAIPRRGYAACKTFLRDYGAMIEFDSPADLLEQLQDRGRVRELQERAWHARGQYAAEQQGPALVQTLDRIADTGR